MYIGIILCLWVDITGFKARTKFTFELLRFLKSESEKSDALFFLRKETFRSTMIRWASIYKLTNLSRYTPNAGLHMTRN